jgi:hypothetical protein
MGSFARAPLRLTVACGFVASLLAATASTTAFAGGMDPTPERLVLQPKINGKVQAPGFCQAVAANPALAAKAGALPDSLACSPDNVAFKNLVSELGFALAPSTMRSARTTGFGGFVLSLEASYTHINADGVSKGADGSLTQYWHAGTQGSVDANGNYSTANNSPDSLIGVYTLKARKGLPFGFELDGALGYVSNTSLWTIGADLRWALLEGFRTGPMGYFPDIAIGTGVRTITGSSKMYLTTVGIDVAASKPFTLADEAVLTPYIGYQQLFIYGNSAVLDATPGVDAIQQCGYTGPQASGAPNCNNKVATGTPGQTVPNDGDFNNNITFDPVRIQRNRAFLGVTYRYELLYLGAQFLFDLTSPNSIDADLSATRQWTMSLEGGVFF